MKMKNMGIPLPNGFLEAEPKRWEVRPGFHQVQDVDSMGGEKPFQLLSGSIRFFQAAEGDLESVVMVGGHLETEQPKDPVKRRSFGL